MEESGGIRQKVSAAAHPPLAEGGLHNLYRPHLLQALVAEQEGAVGPQAVQLVGDVLQGPSPERILAGSLNS